MNRRAHVLVGYDIADPKRLRRVMRTCRDFGDRVQLSLYATQVTPRELAVLKERLRRIIVPSEDRVIFISLGPVVDGDAAPRIDTLGIPVAWTDRRTFIF